MGSRYEDQPPELWAEPASLDPTPTWKQFLLVGVLLALMLVLIAGVGLAALATELAAPPALVPGDRLVLARKDLPAVQAPAARVGAPVIGDDRAFWIAQPAPGDHVAVSAWWMDPTTGARCAIVPAAQTGALRAAWATDATCVGRRFGTDGSPIDAPRGLDRYLVSVSDDRVVVNLSRVIRGAGSTPQPRVSPLPEATPTPAPTR